MTEPWVLCVDDEPRVLHALDLHLGSDYTVRIATGGLEGIDLLHSHPDCAVVVTDMRMPQMNGAEFLSAAREITPDSTRVLLTGYSDLGDAVAAVNDGGIFRFLTKPTPPDTLRKAVDDAIEQWRLLRSERILLEQTLHGAVEALIEALEIASPVTFSRARRIEAASRHVAEQLDLDPVWEVALAGLLLRLGWIAVPPDTIDAFLSGRDLTGDKMRMFDNAYSTSARLVGRIPRLDGVAAIIGETVEPSGRVDAPTVVRAVSDFDRLCLTTGSAASALRTLDGTHPREILIAIRSWEGANDDVKMSEVGLAGLAKGMTAERDIVTTSGNLLVRAGTELTEITIERLRNFAASHGVREPLTVSSRRGNRTRLGPLRGEPIPDPGQVDADLEG